MIKLQRLNEGPVLAQVPEAALQMPGRLRPLLQIGLCGMRVARCSELVLQFHDEQPSEHALCFDAPLSGSAELLIPDAYCLGSSGFTAIRSMFHAQPLPPWQERLPLAFWRGSTTGTKHLTPATITDLPRYRLCRTTHQIPHLLDARFTHVVQASDAGAFEALQRQLSAADLITAPVSPWHFGLHRWIVEIDGNVNSWGTLWKLLSGSCLLRVRSNRQQWFHRRLIDYEHLVPVKSDLSDLVSQLQWCRANLAVCEHIADKGKTLARQVVDELGLDLLNGLRNWLQQAVNRDGRHPG